MSYIATARLDDDLAGYFEKQDAAVEAAAAAANGSKATEPAASKTEEKKEWVKANSFILKGNKNIKEKIYYR